MDKSHRRRFFVNPDAVAIGGFVLYAVLFFAGVGFVLFRLNENFSCTSSAAVVVAENAGRLQSMHFIKQLIRHETIIDTEKGRFLVCRAFPAIKGHALVLQRRDDGARTLCDPAEKVCLRLVH